MRRRRRYKRIYKEYSGPFHPHLSKTVQYYFQYRYLAKNLVNWDNQTIYKNKGKENDPKKYRPITIVSCRGKLFTAVLNVRLNEYSEEFSSIKENQCGFRQNYSTLDNIFSIFILFQILKSKKKKLYCAFIDFEKAFDRVWRDCLFYKLVLNQINGKMYNIIFNMYSNIKSCIS